MVGALFRWGIFSTGRAMIIVTERARAELEQLLDARGPAAVRIYLSTAYAGPRLALALDDPRDTDVAVEAAGFTFLVDRELYEAARPVTIHKAHHSFHVESGLQGLGQPCTSHGKD